MSRGYGSRRRARRAFEAGYLGWKPVHKNPHMVKAFRKGLEQANKDRATGTLLAKRNEIMATRKAAASNHPRPVPRTPQDRPAAPPRGGGWGGTRHGGYRGARSPRR